MGKVFNKELEKNIIKKNFWKRLKNFEGKNEEQLKTIENENVQLLKRLNNDKPKLKGLRHQTDKRDKEQLKYFNGLIKLDTSIDYTKLCYQSDNKNKDTFNFNEFGSITSSWISRTTPGEVNWKSIRFSLLLDMLKGITARKKRL